MKIIVGLGNPGDVYVGTRHNVGFDIVESLSKIFNCQEFSLNKKLKSETCKADRNLFVKPQTYMNGSGFAVRAVTDYYLDNDEENYQSLYVIHDDLDIPLGEFKIKFGQGPIAHNGLLSTYQHLGTKNFWHVRVGIDTRDGDRTIPSANYVLQRFNPNELELFKTVKVEIAKQLTTILRN